MDFRAERHRRVDMRHDGALACQKTASRLENPARGRRQVVAGIAGIDLRPRQHFMRQIVQFRRCQGAGKQFAILAASIDRTGRDQQFLAARRFDVMPELVGAQQQRHVIRVLVIGQPDDAADAVGRAHRMGDVEPLQAENPLAAARQLEGGRAAHAADADDDDVIYHVHSIDRGTGPAADWSQQAIIRRSFASPRQEGKRVSLKPSLSVLASHDIRPLRKERAKVSLPRRKPGLMVPWQIASANSRPRGASSLLPQVA